MRWIKSSLSLAKYSAVSVAAFTMVISPVAQGAGAKAAAKANVSAGASTNASAKVKPKVQSVSDSINYNVNKKAVLEYLKYTGLNNKKKRISVGEFYSKMRGYFPKKLQRDMDRWARENRNELMPEFEVSTYKDSEGKEHVRLLISKGGQTITASFNPESKAKFVKVNNVYLTKDDILFHDQAIGKMVHGDKSIKKSLEKVPYRKPLKQSVSLSYQEFKRLTPRQRAEYLVRLRYVTENAQRVMKAYYGEQALNDFNKEFFVKWMLGQEAEAAEKVRGARPGEPCVVSGYVSVYGENHSCGGNVKGAAHLKEQEKRFGGVGCSVETVSCNPLVYGFKTGEPTGRPFCVSRANVSGSIRDATSKFCHNISPLRKGTQYELEDKKRIIESWMAAKGQKIDLQFDKDGKVSEEQYNAVKSYLDELNVYIDKAVNTCETVPLINIKAVRDEQYTACEAIATRKMDLLAYPPAPMVPLPVPIPDGADGKEKDCSVEKPGSEPDENGNCVCLVGTSDGVINEDGKDRPACVAPIPLPGDDTEKECNKDEKRDEKTGECVAACVGWCKWGKWVIGGAVIAGVAGLIWWMTKGDDDDDKDKQKPYDPCPPAPAICMPNPAPVTPPPVTEPPPVTTSPTPVDVVPTPAVTPFVESSSGSATSTSGGVR